MTALAALLASKKSVRFVLQHEAWIDNMNLDELKQYVAELRVWKTVPGFEHFAEPGCDPEELLAEMLAEEEEDSVDSEEVGS